MLILDEPTNHLDIESREVFEDALIEFPGTSVIVSHDRYFLNKVPTQIYELKEGKITVYRGSYDYYLEKSSELAARQEDASPALPEAGRRGASQEKKDQKTVTDKEKRLQARLEEKEKQAEARRRERRIEELEKMISLLEEEIRCLEEEMCQEKYLSDHVKLAELSGEAAEKRSALEETYAEWEELAE